jgi:ATP-dependent Clp protease ATP-binding subunit ClpX
MFLKRQEEEILRCSFCSKTDDQVDTLISNPSERSGRVCICNECVEICNSVLEDHRKSKAATVEARLRAAVLEEHKKAIEARATVLDRLKALAAHQ